MDWGSDELGHRSAAARGWTAELRAADPEDVDDTVAGAVEFATATAAADANEAVTDGAGAVERETTAPAVADAATMIDADAAGVAAAAEAAAADVVAGEVAAADVADSDPAGDASVTAASATDTSTLTCGFCRREVAEAEALDADGLPIGEFEWVADPDVGRQEAYHRECVDAGEGRFLPWSAGGVLGDE